MSAGKSTTVFGLLAKLESSYGAATTLAAADDGVLLAEPFEFVREPIHDGARGRSNGTTGPYKRVAPSGFGGNGTPQVEMRGAGAAYSASVLPPDIHVLLRASGHSATLDATVSAEKYTYAPVGSSYASAAFEMYSRGEKFPASKGYADFGFAIEAGGIALADFPLFVIPGTLADASVPSITYNTTTLPPKAEGISFSLNPNSAGAITSLVVRSIEFRKNLAIGSRADMNAAAAHQGFHIGMFDPELTVTIEAPAFTTWNPYTAFGSGHGHVISFTVGSTQYNRFVFTANQAYQKQEPEKGEDGEGVALLTLRFQLASSTPVLFDHYSLAFT